MLPTVEPVALEPTLRPAAPTGLVIPALGVRAPVVGLAMEDAVLTPPADYREAGWWQAGAKPGARRGHVLITGHTVHTGGGVFDDLDELHAGDRVEVSTRRGRLAYDVVRVRYLTIDQLAASAARLFRQDAPARLVLVTCSGWDGVEYHGNTVVIARPASDAPDPVTPPSASPAPDPSSPAVPTAPTSVPTLVPVLPQGPSYDWASGYEGPTD